MWHPQWYLTIARSLLGTQGEAHLIEWNLEYQIQFVQIYMVKAGVSLLRSSSCHFDINEGSVQLTKQN
jgi:hypothetical protein